MGALRSMWRLLGIAAVLARYRLDELIDAAHLFRPLKWLRAMLPRPRADIERLTRGARLRLALEELGPIFVKFGQILSTRRDLLPNDVAMELALLQDRVAPFPGAQAQQQIETALAAPIGQLFRSFEVTPLASASIAQVHAACLADGREVVVKVLRPGIAGRIEADVALLRAFGKLAARFHPNADKIRPLDVVAEIERTLRDELDLMREGASASLLRRNFLDSDDLYVPEVIWSHSKDGALTMERVRGIPADDIAALDAAGIDRARLAEKGVRVFYTQVFRDNFFHADAHAGNVWVDAERKENPRYIALDFGIMGALPRDDLRYLAENFTAMFNQDYRRIAELHVEAGWMPAHIRLEELEAAVRTVCEPYFTRPLSEISLGEVLVKLFSVARRYELTIQPQLILLQKTLLNIEGLGRLLHPKLDIWATAKPVLAEILRTRYGFAMAAKEMRSRLPDWLAQAPELPRLVHDYLDRALRGTLEYRFASNDLRRLADESRSGQRRTVFAVLGSGLLIAGAVIYSVSQGGPQLFGQPLLAVLLAVASAMAFLAAWPRED